MRTLLFSLLFITAFVAFPALAEDGFKTLAPVPNIDAGSDATLESYLNSVFLLVISLAAMLAVLRIVLGGFQYMTQEAVTQQQQARQTIQNAVIGLLILLGVVLILETINPQILNLSSLTSGLSTQTQTTGGAGGGSGSTGGGTSSGGSTADLQGLLGDRESSDSSEIREFIISCVRAGGAPTRLSSRPQGDCATATRLFQDCTRTRRTCLTEARRSQTACTQIYSSSCTAPQ